MFPLTGNASAIPSSAAGHRPADPSGPCRKCPEIIARSTTFVDMISRRSRTLPDREVRAWTISGRAARERLVSARTRGSCSRRRATRARRVRPSARRKEKRRAQAAQGPALPEVPEVRARPEAGDAGIGRDRPLHVLRGLLRRRGRAREAVPVAEAVTAPELPPGTARHLSVRGDSREAGRALSHRRQQPARLVGRAGGAGRRPSRGGAARGGVLPGQGRPGDRSSSTARRSVRSSRTSSSAPSRSASPGRAVTPTR